MEFWQKEPNSVWYTDERLYCDLCRGNKKWIIEMTARDKTILICHDHLKDQMAGIFYRDPDLEFIKTRLLTDDIFETRKTVRTRERAKLTPTLRYRVLKRDGFKCVTCGVSASEAKIEADHIIPISRGGTSVLYNLQSLCFYCNKGKGNKLENEVV